MPPSELQDASSPPLASIPLIIASVAAAVLLVLMPVTVRLTALPLPDGPSVLYVFDIATGTLVVAWLTHQLAARPQLVHFRSPTLIYLFVLTALIATAAGPHLSGWVVFLRLMGALVLGLFLVAVRQSDRIVFVALLILTTCIQALLSFFQRVLGHDLSLNEFGERIGLFPFADTIAPVGTFFHPYWLAHLCCLATGLIIALALRNPRPQHALVAALVVAPLGLTLSRASLLAIVPLFLVLGVRAIRDHRAVPLFLALVVSFGAAATVNADAWLGRVDRTLSPTYEANGSGVGGRLMLAREALSLIGSNPLVGVGPGNYIRAAEEELGPGFSGEISHSGPLLLTAELGVPAGLIFSALLLAAGVRALRSGLGATCVYLSFLPLLLLDAFAYSRPQGIVLTAVWLGVAWSWDQTGGAVGRTAIPMEIGWPRETSKT